MPNASRRDETTIRVMVTGYESICQGQATTPKDPHIFSRVLNHDAQAYFLQLLSARSYEKNPASCFTLVQKITFQSGSTLNDFLFEKFSHVEVVNLDSVATELL